MRRRCTEHHACYVLINCLIAVVALLLLLLGLPSLLLLLLLLLLALSLGALLWCFAVVFALLLFVVLGLLDIHLGWRRRRSGDFLYLLGRGCGGSFLQGGVIVFVCALPLGGRGLVGATVFLRSISKRPTRYSQTQVMYLHQAFRLT
jgi:hypothetical protein